MKKRVLLSIIFTGVIVGLTSQFWLIREPVKVSFNAYGNGDATFEAVLNKKDNDEFARNNKGRIDINLHSASEVVIPVYKAKHPKRFQIIIRKEHANGSLKITNIKVNDQILDLTKFYSKSCSIKIETNSILINDLQAFSQIFSSETLNVKPNIIFDIRVFLIIMILGYLLTYKLTSYVADFKSIENKSRIEILFLTAFFILMLVPSLNISDDLYDKVENRKLAEFKPLITKDNINYSFGEDFNNWYSDRFLGRKSIINFYNKLRFFLTYYIYEQNGYYYNKKTQWAFAKDEFSTKNNSKYFPTYEKNIRKLDSFCKKNGIKLYIVIAPVKAEVYPDAIYPYKNMINNGEKFEKYINKSFGNNIITYPLEDMQVSSKYEFIFSKGDVHWSEYGSFITYKALMKNMKRDFPNIKVLDEKDFTITKNKKVITDYPGTHYHKGHNYNVMRVGLKHNNTFYSSYESKYSDKLKRINYPERAASDSYYLYGNPQKVYLVGNSFSENLYVFVKYAFKEVKKRRTNNPIESPKFKMSRFEKEILEFKPDILIIVLQSIGIDSLKDLYSEEE